MLVFGRILLIYAVSVLDLLKTLHNSLALWETLIMRPAKKKQVLVLLVLLAIVILIFIVLPFYATDLLAE